jgi:hypothetical protein
MSKGNESRHFEIASDELVVTSASWRAKLCDAKPGRYVNKGSRSSRLQSLRIATVDRLLRRRWQDGPPKAQIIRRHGRNTFVNALRTTRSTLLRVSNVALGAVSVSL